MRLITGTSGYDYPEWVGADLFYPPGLQHARSDWLTYYASQFALIELNFTYYGETSPKQIEQMLKRIDTAQSICLLEGTFKPRADFEFVIKTYASLTHSIDDQWPQQAAKFLKDTAPLRESGKLLGVLAQFPSRAHCGPELLGYVRQLAQTLAPLQLIAEFRHAPWYQPEVQAELAEAGIVVAGIDAPQEAKLPTVLGDYPTCQQYPVAMGQQAALPFAYVRMHGRREGSWWTGDAASRYEYRYSESQLERLAQRIITSSAAKLYVAFNNHRFGEAPRNAVRMQAIVEELMAKLGLSSTGQAVSLEL